MRPAGIVVRPPELDGRIARAEEIGDEGGEQRGRMQRAAPGFGEVDLRPGRRLGEEPGPEQRQRRWWRRPRGRPPRSAAGSRGPRPSRPTANARRPCRSAHRPPSSADLVRLQHHQPAAKPAKAPDSDRGALQHARRQPEGDGEEGEAGDLADMLHPPRGRGAEGEDERRQQRRRPGASRDRGRTSAARARRPADAPAHRRRPRGSSARARSARAGSRARRSAIADRRSAASRRRRYGSRTATGRNAEPAPGTGSAPGNAPWHRRESSPPPKARASTGSPRRKQNPGPPAGSRRPFFERVSSWTPRSLGTDGPGLGTCLQPCQ